MQVVVKKVRSPVSLGANKKHGCNYCRCNGVEMSEGTTFHTVLIADVEYLSVMHSHFPVDTTTLLHGVFSDSNIFLVHSKSLKTLCKRVVVSRQKELCIIERHLHLQSLQHSNSFLHSFQHHYIYNHYSYVSC